VVPVSQTHVAPPAVSEPALSRTSKWTGRRIAALSIGSLLVLLSLALLAGGGTALWADRTQRDDGFVTTGFHQFSTSGSALTTETIHLGGSGVGWLYAPGLLGKVRLRVTPVKSGPSMFVGIGRSTDVDRYLAGVNRTVISDFWGNKVKSVEGGTARSRPGAQGFWVASSTGSGSQTLVWEPTKGSWRVVVMKANARSGIDVRANLGARMPAALWVAIGLLIGGAIFLAGGGLLIASAFGRNAALPRDEKEK
jgi:hypothetical protein